ncbi:hypothetical protein AM500_23045 [Bacillus sp. FJAT-18017]|nr:hypothetical protein AM500_23045 [Bacillus sp. FJAT-18017]
MVSPDQLKTGHAGWACPPEGHGLRPRGARTLLEKAIAFPSCDVNASEAYSFVARQVIEIMNFGHLTEVHCSFQN